MTLADLPSLEPTTRRFTRAEYYQMYELGFFENQRVELIDGEIIRMSPQNNPHALTISIIDGWLHRSLPNGFTVRCQLPLVASELTEPEPDFAVLAGEPESHREHPHSGLLIIEVASTSQRHDRKKATIYASSNVPEYWLLDVEKRQLEVYRGPVADENSPHGFKYAQVEIFTADQHVRPLKIPVDAVAVSRLLPKV